MHSDSHFVIGQAHTNGGQPCQDYALTGSLPSGAFAVVSDGCSSGGRTDVGARIVALATAEAIRQTPKSIHDKRRGLIEAARHLYGCSQDDLLATCLYAVVTKKHSFVHIQGDGVVALRQPDDTLLLAKYEWSKNAPAYPVYAADGYRSFRQFYSGVATPLSAEWWQWRGGQFSRRDDAGYTLSEGIAGIRLPLDLAVHRCVALFTDGVAQIDNIDWKDAVVELLGFKTTEGAFAKRRLGRFVKDARLGGRGPIDDLAYAVILL